MCGIFAMFSADRKKIEETISKKDSILRTIKFRGPDKTSIIEDEKFIAIHTHLIMTGYVAQPVMNDSFLLLFNGEIYNDYQNYSPNYSDTDFLVNQILDKGVSAFSYLDGKFAICLNLFESNKLILVTDPFGTKPLYYQIGPDYCVIGTYDSTVAACRRKEPIKQVPASTVIEISLKDFSVKKSRRTREFDFSSQTTKTFEKWNTAFKNAILKRTTNTQHKCFISLRGCPIIP